MEDHFAQYNICREFLRTNLLYVGKNSKAIYLRSGKKIRCTVSGIKHTERFEKRMLSWKRCWSELLSSISNKVRIYPIYDMIASDLLSILREVTVQYLVEDECLLYAIRCIVIPVVVAITSETAINKQVHDRQNSRRHFLMNLLTVEIPEEDNRGQGHHRNHRWNINFSIVTKHMVRALFDSITKHNERVAKPNFDCKEYKVFIYHIVNITYILLILSEFFDKMKERIKNIPKEQVTWARVEHLRDAVEELEKETRQYLERLDTNIRWVVYKGQLCELAEKLQLIKSILTSLMN